jgi:sortase B
MAGRNTRKRTAGDVLTTILMLVALAVFLYAGYTLYGFYREYKAGTDEYIALNNSYTDEDETEDYEALEDDDEVQRVEGREVKNVTWDTEEVTLPTLRNPIDFESLQKENEDLVAWIKIRALDLSYPVMQADDNEYYLHRTFEREDNFAGCIFLNCDNKPDFTDMNTIIYGHNMKNGSMFGKIKQFSDETVFNKSKFFWIYTKDLIFQYRIFSVAVVNNTGLAYQTFYTTDQFQELIDYAYSHSEVDTSGVEVTTGDKIVTLSTCTGDSSTRRVVFGKLVQMYASR